MITFCLLTNILSPHQSPLAHALVKDVTEKKFRYIATEEEQPDRVMLGWESPIFPEWVLKPTCQKKDLLEASCWPSNADVLLCGERNLELFENRCCLQKRTLYMSERWFKPPWGMLRLLNPAFIRMAYRVVKCMQSNYFYYLPIGVYAAQDMARLNGLMRGDLRCLFCPPSVVMEESIPLARFKEDVSESSVGHELSEGFMYWTKRERYYGLHKMRLWGYFVEAELQAKKKDKEGQANKSEEDTKFVKPHLLRILWVGRLLYWKRVDGLIRTVVRLLEEGQDVSLQIVGMGTEEIRLKKIAGVWLLEQPGRVRGISFSTPVRISEVRHLMRESDVFVLPSNGYEGWGAVVNEAMTEGCAVIASRQSGAGATLINDSKNGILFNAGDWRGLHKALSMFIENPSYMQIVADQGKYTIRNFWSPESGAKRLLDFCNSL